MSKPSKTITVARAIIRIGDAARSANDYSLLGALHEMVEQLTQHGVNDTDVDMDLLLEYVEAADGCDYCRVGDGKDSVDKLTTKINQQLARHSQAQVEASDQSVLEFEPMVHLVNAELLDYFDENHPVNWRSVERDLPSRLHDYHLVAGSVEVQEILPRELEVISF